MERKTFISVILPLKLEWEPCYRADEGVGVGERVKVVFAGKEYSGVVSGVGVKPEIKPEQTPEIKPEPTPESKPSLTPEQPQKPGNPSGDIADNNTSVNTGDKSHQMKIYLLIMIVSGSIIVGCRRCFWLLGYKR